MFQLSAQSNIQSVESIKVIQWKNLRYVKPNERPTNTQTQSQPNERWKWKWKMIMIISKLDKRKKNPSFEEIKGKKTEIKWGLKNETRTHVQTKCFPIDFNVLFVMSVRLWFPGLKKVIKIVLGFCIPKIVRPTEGPQTLKKNSSIQLKFKESKRI